MSTPTKIRLYERKRRKVTALIEGLKRNYDYDWVLERTVESGYVDLESTVKAILKELGLQQPGSIPQPRKDRPRPWKRLLVGKYVHRDDPERYVLVESMHREYVWYNTSGSVRAFPAKMTMREKIRERLADYLYAGPTPSPLS